MLRELLPLCDARRVHARNANPRALPPATLQSLARQLGFDGASAPSATRARALAARARARAGPDGVVLATGSIYLIADLLRPAGAPGSDAVNDDDALAS